MTRRRNATLAEFLYILPRALLLMAVMLLINFPWG